MGNRQAFTWNSRLIIRFMCIFDPVTYVSISSLKEERYIFILLLCFLLQNTAEEQRQKSSAGHQDT